jgi:branched-chain amino acid transport system permease protein
LIEHIIVRRIGRDPISTVIIVFIGLMVIINSLAGAIFGYTVKSFASPFPDKVPLVGSYLSGHEIGMLGVTLIMLALVFSFFRFTPLGLMMRAAAQNPISCRLVGVRVGLMLSLGWGLAATIGAVAGMMAAPMFYLDPNMMGGILLYGFAGALLGGINNPWGATIGGFAVGILDTLAGVYVVGTELKLAVALAIIIGVLLVRPAGLFGHGIIRRV